MSSFLNKRELAALVWLVVASVVAVAWKPARQTIKILCYSFAEASTLHRIIYFAYVYQISLTGLLCCFGVWTPILNKSTILWFVTVPVPALYLAVRDNNPTNIIARTFRNISSLTIFVEFIANSYSFDLSVELIILPAGSILVLLTSVAENKKDLRAVYSVSAMLLGILGVAILWRSIAGIIYRPSDFFNGDSSANFLSPIILTLLFLPYTYGVALRQIYVYAGIRLSHQISSPKLKTYAWIRAALAFRTDAELLNRWLRDFDGRTVRGVGDVERSIRNVYRELHRAKKPIYVPYKFGWSPHKAIHFLTDYGLRTEDYHPVGPGLPDWCAASTSLALEDGVMPSNLIYYVEGDRNIARRLKLVMQINNV